MTATQSFAIDQARRKKMALLFVVLIFLWVGATLLKLFEPISEKKLHVEEPYKETAIPEKEEFFRDTEVALPIVAEKAPPLETNPLSLEKEPLHLSMEEPELMSTMEEPELATTLEKGAFEKIESSSTLEKEALPIFQTELNETTFLEESRDETILEVEEIKPAPLKVHRVEKGETLSSIAQKYYGDSKQWVLIYEKNQEKIPNKNSIRPNLLLEIP